MNKIEIIQNRKESNCFLINRAILSHLWVEVVRETREIVSCGIDLAIMPFLGLISPGGKPDSTRRRSFHKPKPPSVSELNKRGKRFSCSDISLPITGKDWRPSFMKTYSLLFIEDDEEIQDGSVSCAVTFLFWFLNFRCFGIITLWSIDFVMDYVKTSLT